MVQDHFPTNDESDRRLAQTPCWKGMSQNSSFFRWPRPRKSKGENISYFSRQIECVQDGKVRTIVTA
jgi:hypothetical protein